MNDALRDVCEEMQLSDREIQRLFKVFNNIDTNGTGTISKDELFHFLSLERGWFLDTLFDAMDTDRDGQWTFTEWLSAMARVNLYTHEQLMDFLFKVFDKQDTGYIDGVRLIHTNLLKRDQEA